MTTVSETPAAATNFYQPVFWTLPKLQSLTEYIDGQTELIGPPQMRQAILATPGFPQSVPVPPSPQPYSIVAIPSKGLGMIAARDLHFGELIVAERALIIRSPAFAPLAQDIPRMSSMTPEQILSSSHAGAERSLEYAIERMENNPLTRRHAEAYKKLANSHLSDGSGPLFGIWRTNSFGIQLPVSQNEEHTMAAVFDKLSRINHSCSANTMRTWCTASFSMQVYAIRDIKKGEEISTNYDKMLMSASERQAKLVKYGFDCRCRSCSDPSSDGNRLRISNIKEEYVISIAQWAGSPHLPDDVLLKPALEQLKLIEEEGVQAVPHYARILHQLSLIYYVLGEPENAKRYHQRWRVWQRMNGTEANSMLNACMSILVISHAASFRES